MGSVITHILKESLEDLVKGAQTSIALFNESKNIETLCELHSRHKVFLTQVQSKGNVGRELW